MDSLELRETLSRVNLYKRITRDIRSGAGGTLFNGLLYLFFSALIYSINNAHPYFYVHLLIGFAEVFTGLWKRFRPTPECVLADSLISLSFAGLIALRTVLDLLGMVPWPLHPLTLAFGAFAGFGGVRSFQAYLALRQIFRERPTQAQIQYVTDLAQEIESTSPRDDASILDLPTRPDMKAQLADEVVFVLDLELQEVELVDAGGFELVKLPPREGQKARAYAIIQGQQTEPFPLGEATWNNYRAWAGERPDAIATAPT
jgi:hypothetical protein